MLKRLAIASLLVMLLPLKAAALQTEDLLALVAMPLAVAAVSELPEVPQNELIDVVTLLNDAAVTPAQFVEVVRYIPVALVTPGEGPTFVQFVRTQEQQGLRGTQLVTVIEDRFRAIGVPADLVVTAPRVVEVDRDEFFPQIVRTRIAEVKTHPHGGPPGQLKKVAGVQTGAEIVHGERGRMEPKVRDRVVVAEPKLKSKPGKGHGRGHGGGKGKGKGKG